MKSIALFSLILVCSLIVESLYAQEFGTGLMFEDEVTYSTQKSEQITRGLTVNLPVKASLKPYCPTPKNQGETQTCVGWAFGYGMHSILQNKSAESGLTKNADMTMSGSFIYRMISDDPHCQKVTKFSDAMKTLTQFGNVHYKEFAQNCPGPITKDIYSKSKNNRISSFVKFFDMSNPLKGDTLEMLKNAIVNHSPVVVGLVVKESFKNLKNELYVPGYGNLLGNHAVVLIGYDDTKYGGSFEFLNSYGTNWGNHGYFYMKYKDFLNVVKVAVEPVNSIKIKDKEDQISPDFVNFDFAGELVFKMTNQSIMKSSFFILNDYVKTDRLDHIATSVYKSNDQIITGKYVGYRMNESYTDWDAFRVHLKNEQPAYVYFIGTDHTKNVNILFPDNKSFSAALNYKNTEIILPYLSKRPITLDETKGVDIFCMLYSKIELDIDEISVQLQKLNGSFFERLQKVLGDKLVRPEFLRYYKNSVKFEIDSHGYGLIVPVIVEIPHI